MDNIILYPSDDKNITAEGNRSKLSDKNIIDFCILSYCHYDVSSLMSHYLKTDSQ